MLVLASVVTGSSQSRVPQANSSWREYRDDANGIAFKYPPDLRVVTPSVTDAHIEGLVNLVHLVSADDPRPHPFPILRVLVIVCGDPKANPRVPCLNEAWFRRVCHRFEPFPVGNRRGLQCVDYGSAACHWSAVVLRDGRRVTILTPASDHLANGETNDRSVCADRLVTNRKNPPLDGILASFAFEDH